MVGQQARVRRDWPAVVAAQSSSGLSARAYCAQQGINLSLFYKWRRRCGGSEAGAAASPFVELQSVGSAAASGVTLVSPAGWRVEVRSDFDPETLARVCSCVASGAACWA